MKLIKENMKEIIASCEKYNVAELFVFGSVLSEEFSSESDIDFLVKFSNVDCMDYFDNYMNFKYSLENILSRKIDLLEIQTVKNPILKKSINKNKKMIYGRENTKVAV